MPEWLKGADCKSAGLIAYVGSNPTLPIKNKIKWVNKNNMVSNNICKSIQRALDSALSGEEFLEGVYDSIEVFPDNEKIDGMDVFIIDVYYSQDFDVGHGLDDEWVHDDVAYEETLESAISLIHEIIERKLKSLFRKSRYDFEYLAQFLDDDERIVSFQYGISKR